MDREYGRGYEEWKSAGRPGKVYGKSGDKRKGQQSVFEGKRNRKKKIRVRAHPKSWFHVHKIRFRITSLTSFVSKCCRFLTLMTQIKKHYYLKK